MITISVTLLISLLFLFWYKFSIYQLNASNLHIGFNKLWFIFFDFNDKASAINNDTVFFMKLNNFVNAIVLLLIFFAFIILAFFVFSVY